MVRWWHVAAVFGVVGPANAGDLSLERIMLSSGGVGREFQRSRLARCELDLVVGQPRDLSSGAVRELLRQATKRSGGSGRSRSAETRHGQHRG